MITALLTSVRRRHHYPTIVTSLTEKNTASGSTASPDLNSLHPRISAELQRETRFERAPHSCRVTSLIEDYGIPLTATATEICGPIDTVLSLRFSPKDRRVVEQLLCTQQSRPFVSNKSSSVKIKPFVRAWTSCGRNL